MAKKNSAKKSSEFIEYKVEGKEFDYSGRLFPERQREAGKLTITPMTLCLSEQITIKGCSFYQTKDNAWIGGPQYKVGDDYKDYLYIDKSLNEDMEKLAEEIAGLLRK